MTTTNVYQGMASDKNSSRVLQAPGGDSSNIFGHYREASERERAEKHQQGTQAVIQSVNNAGGANGIANNYTDNRDSFNANRQRNHGEGTPFATNDSMVSTGQAKVVQPQVAPSDYMTPKEAQAANRSRNQGQGAPFAVGDSPPEKHVYPQEVVGDYQTPQQRQANNPNKAGNSFSNLFGESEAESHQGKNKGKALSQYNLKHSPCKGIIQSHLWGDWWHPSDTNKLSHLRHCGALTVSKFNPVTWSAKPGSRLPPSPSGYAAPPAGFVKNSVLADESVKPANPHAKVSTHNPVTWEAYSNFDATKDHPAHRSRFENFASTKAGTFNPITGKDHVEAQPSTKVIAPPGGKSSFQF